MQSADVEIVATQARDELSCIVAELIVEPVDERIRQALEREAARFQSLTQSLEALESRVGTGFRSADEQLGALEGKAGELQDLIERQAAALEREVARFESLSQNLAEVASTVNTGFRGAEKGLSEVKNDVHKLRHLIERQAGALGTSMREVVDESSEKMLSGINASMQAEAKNVEREFMNLAETGRLWRDSVSEQALSAKVLIESMASEIDTARRDLRSLGALLVKTKAISEAGHESVSAMLGGVVHEQARQAELLRKLKVSLFACGSLGIAVVLGASMLLFRLLS